MQIAPPSRKQPKNGFALFQLGFRPFFLGGTAALLSFRLCGGY